VFLLAVLKLLDIQNLTTTSLGLVGRLKFPPRTAFSFTLAGTSNSAMGILLVHEPVLQ
jgi:hypothetical protein